MDALTIILIIFGLFIFSMVVFFAFFIWWIKVYKYKFRVYDNIAGTGWQEVAVIRGRLLRVRGSLSDAVFWVPKIKSYLSSYGRKMGKNMYYIFKGDDGFYYNCVLGDLDAHRGMLDIEPVNVDVRAFHTTNQKNINETYAKPKNWPLVLMSFTIVLCLLLMIVGGYILYGKINEGLKISQQNIQSSGEVTKSASQIVAKLDEAGLLNPQKTGLIEATPSTGG